MALHVARRPGSGTNDLSARMPANSSISTSVVVSRTSQSQKTPQVALAQIIPCSCSSPQSTTPVSIEPVSRLSQRSLPVHSDAIAAPNANVNASIVIHADGTWTYRMRCTSPMCRSGGATNNPMYDPTSNRPIPARPMT